MSRVNINLSFGLSSSESSDFTEETSQLSSKAIVEDAIAEKKSAKFTSQSLEYEGVKPKTQVINVLFLDVGGVLLTNGWDHVFRKNTAQHFGIDYEAMSKRHEMVFDIYERGKITLIEYLKWVIFNEKRSFTLEELTSYIFTEARAFTEMIDYVKEVKAKYKLKVAILSNEGRELATDRFIRFNFSSFVDFYIVSGFVGLRKPDADIYHLALNVAQFPPSQVCYIDDRALLIESAQTLNIRAIHHTSIASTKESVNQLLSS